MKNWCTILLISWIVLTLSGSVRLARAEVDVPVDVSQGENLGEELFRPQTDTSTMPTDQPRLGLIDEEVDKPRVAQDEELPRVVKHMQTAQTLLERSDATGSASSAQAAAIRGLDAMIAELARRQSLCQGGEYSGRNGDKSSPPQPAIKPGTSSQAGNTPAESASATTGRDTDLTSELSAVGSLAKDLWGSLPQRQREQVLQPQRDEFLPKYASEIEAYFRALADPNRTPPETQ